MLRRALLLGLGAAACGPKPLPPLPPAPRVTSAAELVPSDLDVVVRVDLARFRSALGAAGLAAAARGLLVTGKAYASEADPARELVLASLLETDTVYLGYRPSALGAPLDRVLVLQGHFTPMLRPAAGFGSATDLGGDVRYWDAKEPPPRDGVARLYAVGERLRVFVSEAELDAMERTLAGFRGKLQPLEEGMLSLAARPALLGRLAGQGRLRELLEKAVALQAVFEFEADGLRVKADLLLDGPDSAQELADAGELVLARALGEAGSAMQLRLAGERLRLSVLVSRQQLAVALACFGLASSSASACPW